MRAMVFLGTALALGCQAPTPAPPSTADDEAAIRAVMQGFDNAWNAADTVALREYLEEDAVQVLVGASRVTEDRSAMLAAWADHFQRFHSEYHMTAQRLWISGDLAVVVESDSITATPAAGGETTRSAGKGLMAFRRGADGRWQLVATN
jgi:uncharacterized protein (TIGR02246 family)